MTDTSKSDVASCLSRQKEHKIRTECIFPPIPIRAFDWCATFDNYEPGCPIGYGRTEQEAITDLLEITEE